MRLTVRPVGLVILAVAPLAVGAVLYVHLGTTPELDPSRSVVRPPTAPEAGVAQSVSEVRLIDNKVAAVVDRVITIRPGQFTQAQVEKLCRNFLTEFGPDRGMRRLIIGTTERTVSLALFKPWARPLVEESGVDHKGSTSNDGLSDFDRTVEVIRKLNLPKGPVARVLAVGGAAVLAIRDDHGYTERLLAGSSDPTLIRDGTFSYRLLHFVLTMPGPALRPENYTTQLFFEVRPDVSVASVARLTRRFKSVVRGGQVDVNVRRDAFFADIWSFPAILPFIRQSGIPNRLQYLLGGHLSCGLVGDRQVACSGDHFHP